MRNLLFMLIRDILYRLMFIRDILYHQREHCQAARIKYGGILVRIITFSYFFVLN
jgi:hypothetical protein